MGLLNLFSKTTSSNWSLEHVPAGSLAVNRKGGVVASTLPTTIPLVALEKIGQTIIKSFESARAINLPLSELVTHFNGFKIVARELRGGALIFLEPEITTNVAVHTLPTMSNPTLDDFILYLETYIECWKQFNHYVNLARMQKFTPEDEAQFLEIKILITQGLEVILAAIEQGGPRKEEVMSLINGAPSIRYLAEHDTGLQTVEGQWHKIFLIMQSLLGRFKVQQQKNDGEWKWSSLFGRG